MKKKILLSLLVIGLSLGMYTDSISAGCKTSGSNTYCATTVSNITKYGPVYESQVRHQSNMTTQVHVSKSVTNTMSATASLQWGLSAWGTSVAATAGVSFSTSKATNTSISFTLNSSNASGLYRIEVAFPGNEVLFTQAKLPEYMIVAQRRVSYAPRVNAAYHLLRKYA